MVLSYTKSGFCMSEYIQRRPNFLGVGAMKSATTWLSECLRYHPDVYISDVKEIHFFSRFWDKGVDWYLEHFSGVKGERAIGEFSNTYVDDIECCYRIKDVLGEIKIIICLRDPIDRFVSHYKYNYRVYPEAKDLPIRELDVTTLEDVTTRFPELLSRGLYSNALKNYIDIFGRHNVFVTFKECTDDNPEGEIRKLYRFLGVDDSFTPDVLNKKVSPGVVPRFFWLEKLRVEAYKFMRGVFPRAIVWIRKFRVAELYRKLNKSSSSITINSEARDWLISYYREDVRALERLLEYRVDSIWEKY